MKKWLSTILFIIFGGGIALGATLDVSTQTRVEVSNIITTQQERCLQDTGKYCQFKKDKVNTNLFGTKIKKHDYEIVIDVWEGGAGDLHDQKGYTIRYIEPVTMTASST